MSLEENIVKCIEEKGVPLSVVSRRTGVPYSSLYNSLMSKDRSREIRGSELVAVCKFLEVDPMDFAG